MKYALFSVFMGVFFAVSLEILAQDNQTSQGSTLLNPDVVNDIQIAVKNDYKQVLQDIVNGASGLAKYDAIIQALLAASAIKGPKAGSDLFWSLLKQHLSQDAFDQWGLKFEHKTKLIDIALQRNNEREMILNTLYFIDAIHPSNILAYADKIPDKHESNVLKEYVSQTLPSTQPRPLNMNWRWIRWWQFHKPTPIAVNAPVKRYPIVVLFDQDNQGGLVTGYLANEDRTYCDIKVQDAFFNDFMAHIFSGNKAVISSRQHTCGLLTLFEVIPEFRGLSSRTFQPDPDYVDLRTAVQKAWNVYLVPNTAYVVWIPKEYANYYGKIFDMRNLQAFPINTKGDIKKGCPAATFKGKPSGWGIAKFNVKDFSKIFNVSNIGENDVLDFLIGGHGGSGTHMAGLPLKKDLTQEKKRDQQIQALFDFLNTINTGFVLIRSCFAGGPNLTLLQAKDTGVVHDYGYNFVLIILSTDDKAVTTDPKSSSLIADAFFANTDGRGKALDELLEKLVKALPGKPLTSADIQGFLDFPQVWLPGGIGFQSFNISKDVRTIGRVAKTVHELEKRPIIIDNTYAVLWYVSDINVPVEVSATKAVDPSLTQQALATQWSALPMAMTDAQFVKLSSQISSQPDLVKQKYPAIAKLMESDMHKIKSWIAASRDSHFPDFVIMGEVKNRHLVFKKIVVRDQGNPLMGVGRFLRDSIADVGSGVFEKTFVIKELEGVNDLPLYMEISRYAAMGGDLSKEDSSITEFEKKLTETVGQPITLKNVILSINPPEHKGHLVFYIPIEGEYWSYKVPLQAEVPEGPEGAYGWKFEKTPDAEKRNLEKLVA